MEAAIDAGLHVGRDGWLFWVGRTGQVARLYGGGPLALIRTLRWRSLVRGRRRRAGALGAEFRQAVMPDKLSCLGEAEGAPPLDRGRSPGRRLAGSLATDPAWIDLFGPFAEVEPAASLFLKADTHLTARGYLLAYEAICRGVRARPSPTVTSAATVTRRLAGDLGSKMIPPVEEDVETVALAPRARRIEANALMRLREGRPITEAAGLLRGSRALFRLDDPEADPRTVMLFGDSYSFVDGGLGPMLAETFRETHLIWSESLDWGYVARIGPGLVIHQIAERFLRRVPRDGLDVEALADARVKAYGATA